MEQPKKKISITYDFYTVGQKSSMFRQNCKCMKLPTLNNVYIYAINRFYKILYTKQI